jgi:hypothetical protein
LELFTATAFELVVVCVTATVEPPVTLNAAAAAPAADAAAAPAAATPAAKPAA